jgi:hypothetical protein
MFWIGVDTTPTDGKNKLLVSRSELVKDIPLTVAAE